MADPLLALTDGLLRDVARVFNTKGRAYIYISNGHGAWEAALTNVLSKGDKILVLESGRFAINWGEHARRMGVEIETLKGDIRRPVRPADIVAKVYDRLGIDPELRVPDRTGRPVEIANGGRAIAEILV